MESYSSFDHLVASICSGNGEGWMFCMTTANAYTVYVDDSGTDKQARIVAAACFASPVKKWKRFESAWIAAEQEFEFEHFHMTEFAACKKTDWCRDCRNGKTNEQDHPWREWSNTKRTKLLRELLRIVCKYGEWGISRAIAKEDIEKYVMRSELRTTAPQWEELTRHFTFVMQACGGDLATWRYEHNMTNDHIKFVFDLTDQQQKDELARVFLGKHGRTIPRIVNGVEQWFSLDELNGVSYESRNILGNFSPLICSHGPQQRSGLYTFME